MTTTLAFFRRPTIALVILLVQACDSPPDTGNRSFTEPLLEVPELDETTVLHQDMSISQMTNAGEILMPKEMQHRLIAEDSLWQEALRIHYNAIVMDGHIDTPTLMLDRNYDFGLRHTAQTAHLDLPRMFEGGLDAPFFAIWVAAGYGEGRDATNRAIAMIAEVERQVAANSDKVEIVTTADNVRQVTGQGRKAILLGLEGGHALQGSPEVLRDFYNRGIRYVTLTHTNTNRWADSSQDRPRWNGLNDLGREMVREMNRLGILVDISHVSDNTFYDAINVSRAPVIASHSSARALTDNVRNIDDDMLLTLRDNRGVIMINFYDSVVNSHLTDDVMAEVYRRIEENHDGDLSMLWQEIFQIREDRGLPRGTVDDVLDHIDHVVNLIGVDYVGLGSDFDGVGALPQGLGEVTRLPWITYGLLSRGYPEADIYKILGGNTLRVIEAAERAASEMQEEAVEGSN